MPPAKPPPRFTGGEPTRNTSPSRSKKTISSSATETEFQVIGSRAVPGKPPTATP